jgi:hypothetical protein
LLSLEGKGSFTKGHSVKNIFSMERSLDTTNAKHITYKKPLLEITILGGIRLDGLDRLRTTLKIQVEHLAIRHNSLILVTNAD